MPGEVLLAAIHRNASPAVISRNIKPWCRSSEGHGANVGDYAAHVSTLDAPTRALLHETLPHAVRRYPQRYPFMLPPPDAARCCWPGEEALSVCCWAGNGSPPDQCHGANATQYVPREVQPPA